MILKLDFYEIMNRYEIDKDLKIDIAWFSHFFRGNLEYLIELEGYNYYLNNLERV